MSQNIFSIGSPLNIAESIREDETDPSNEDVAGHAHSDHLSGSLDQQRSITNANRSSTGVHREKSLTKEQIVERFLGITNIRAKHRYSRTDSTGHWKDAAKKAGHLIDPW